MTDEIQKAIDISNLSDEQIFELYSDVIEWGDSELMAGYCYCVCVNAFYGQKTSTYLKSCSTSFTTTTGYAICYCYKN